ncbi:histidinol dehydrogenase [Solilutibacter tolerans]|uniref:Histidinol dehydrogenase n=1 Tax=Solilutibacter tolerans TaxID=1604334 RepID=A0A1N6X6C5_9GAMM|nr:histidinol dehydrogenase [Lysobacter tolerans]SIQ97875.1 histidinol dehydrogenase [Lysobacter tolerans]
MKRMCWDVMDEAARDAVLQRPTQAASGAVCESVRGIVKDVAAQGDIALRGWTRLLDGVTLDAMEVSEQEFADAEWALPTTLREAVVEAASRIKAFHLAGAPQPYEIDTAPGMRCERVLRPISPVGLYVPAGSAPLPSTAMMLVIPATLAGCKEIILCTPPRADGTADPAVLFAARLAPNVRVFKLGGAQAIAAMGLGTGTVPRCEKLFGPGNAYVDEAKRQIAQLSNGPAIDMPAGPSEVLVIADAGGDPDFIAADLLSQAEHGPDSQVFLLSDSTDLLERVASCIDRQLTTLPRASIARAALDASLLVEVRDIEQAIEISNRYAPEHLILALRQPRVWLNKITSAGTVFMGDWTPESLGDYCSGSNHVLPTGGAARAWSGLSVSSFTKALTIQTATRDGLRNVGPCAVELASAEGLQAHALAVQLRLGALA